MKFLFFKEGKSMLTKKKKIFILVGMVVLLVITGYLNYKLNSSIDDDYTPTSTTSANFFVTFREDRSITRAQEIDYLTAIIESKSSSTEAVQTATDMKFQLIAKMDKEFILENLIKAKGFEDTIVAIGSENINAIVKGHEFLSDDQVAQILNVITSEAKVAATNVKIIPIR